MNTQTKLKTMAEKIRSITIVGRRWFEKTNGNTYHSVEIWVNGQQVKYLPFQYGYELQYRQTAQDWIVLWRHAEDNNIELVQTVSDVGRKKDL